MKHAQRTEKYIRLIFNSYISEGDFFKSPCALLTRTNFFLEIFKAKRGCALCNNAHYTTLNTVFIIRSNRNGRTDNTMIKRKKDKSTNTTQKTKVAYL